MDVASSLGGILFMAGMFVIIVGISGAIFASPLFKWIGINHYLGKGIGMGGRFTCDWHLAGVDFVVGEWCLFLFLFKIYIALFI
ncbi:LrgB family protein [Halobacillus rhizosphaerae]|uniref:LrgB family protein n=1 Tax=Halobacillus rhizosphaerae TaxID=3064889 RepID=UPI00398B1C34